MVYAQCDIFFHNLTNFVLVTGLSWNKLDKNHQNASTERTVASSQTAHIKYDFALHHFDTYYVDMCCDFSQKV
ncbi:unnamed protein product [Albugo candida]|uniref:Uncharacterized protein n=1 Tax=Albugo candida TaxID=65357 RepID=A0A024G5Q6_9STRA|nr:unnamed protein product [Albugo candida]|eukprot:CCI41650.1 unnamed protein product [Albugo candida]